MTDSGLAPESLLEVEGLTIVLRHRHRPPASIARDVSFHVNAGEIVGLIGESGSGKTMTAKSLIGLLPDRMDVVSGRVRFRGRDLLDGDDPARVRGRDIALIPQDALHALNPVKTIGWQVGEPLQVHGGLRRRRIASVVGDLLERVHIPDARRRAVDYPHQFSGGMQQRALTAMALSMEPPLILADEPTTALDVTIQAEIIDLIGELRDATGASFLFISHDLALVSSFCDRIYVMYAGEIVESGTKDAIFSHTRHPYTRALIGAAPRLAGNPERLPTIPGRIPRPHEEIRGCRFRERCPDAGTACGEAPRLETADGDHAVRCWYA
ncbi:MAG: ABC transporter ATP-binding protein [bacterium]|nr:ABC transporter ATP-binding protein [bacterium]